MLNDQREITSLLYPPPWPLGWEAAGGEGLLETPTLWGILHIAELQGPHSGEKHTGGESISATKTELQQGNAVTQHTLETSVPDRNGVWSHAHGVLCTHNLQDKARRGSGAFTGGDEEWSFWTPRKPFPSSGLGELPAGCWSYQQDFLSAGKYSELLPVCTLFKWPQRVLSKC